MRKARVKTEQALVEVRALARTIDDVPASDSKLEPVLHSMLASCNTISSLLNEALNSAPVVTGAVEQAVCDFEYAWQKLLDSNHGSDARKIAFDLVALAYGQNTK